MESLQYAKKIELRHDVDVLVAGGGPAGCAAAIAAARNGARVLLIENEACLGGLGTAGLVPAYMQFGDGKNFLAAGIGREILERLWDYGGAEYKKSQTNSIKVEALKRVYEDMCQEAGVCFVFHTKLIDVLVEESGNIGACVLAAKSGVFAAKAKVYIDCTGDGDLAAWAGAPFEKGDPNGNMMAGTLCALWAGIDFSRREDGGDARRIEEAYRDGVFTKLDLHLPGMWKISQSVGGSNAGHVYGVDGTDERSLTEGLVYTRKLYDEYEAYYKKYLAGYENMELITTGSLLGIRESRRIVGEYVLCLSDFLNQSTFEDEIGRYAYPVDIHASDGSRESFDTFHRAHTGYRYKAGESYGVPYRIMLPQKVGNLLVAGRCVSTDRPMQSSIRVMPGCYITGQAAGVAAAVCVRDGITPGRVDVRKVQGILKHMGMYLPNYKA